MDNSSNITQSAAPASISFFHFIGKEKTNRRWLLIALGSVIVQWIIFKFLYPYPDFFSDSYSYIYAASAHLDVNIWPIGYSKFLAAFHALTHSDIALVSFQYFLLESSALYFFFTLLYFHQPGQITKVLLFIFLFFNPLFLYLSNYVNSDPLFAALSLFWFTELIWITNRPRLYQIFTQGILLFLCFAVRNNAYYYPFIALTAFLLSRQRPLLKLAGALAGPLLILPFILHTRELTRKMTGTPQFSLFTGWQLANNALYMRDQIIMDSTAFPSPETAELDLLSRQFFRKIPPHGDYRGYLESYTGNFYIRKSNSPLKQFAFLYEGSRNANQTTDVYSGVAAWGRASSIFAQYGAYLIKSRPLAFARYFLLPNTENYLLPSLEKLELYNLGKDDIPPMVASWFDLEGPDIKVISNRAQGIILYIFPFLFLWMNIQVIINLGWFFISRQYRKIDPLRGKYFTLSGVLWVLNFCFSVFATINVFRYQIFPMIIYFPSSLLLLEFLTGINTKHVNKTRYPHTVTNAAP